MRMIRAAGLTPYDSAVSMAARGARTLLAALLAALLVAAAAAPAAHAAASAADEYTLDLPGVKDAPGGSSGATTAGGKAGDGLQAGVVGEQDAASSPLSDALGSPIALALLAIGAATVGCCVLFGMGQLRPHKH
jgi:hypothetical protein